MISCQLPPPSFLTFLPTKKKEGGGLLRAYFYAQFYYYGFRLMAHGSGLMVYALCFIYAEKTPFTINVPLFFNSLFLVSCGNFTPGQISILTQNNICPCTWNFVKFWNSHIFRGFLEANLFHPIKKRKQITRWASTQSNTCIRLVLKIT